MCANSPKDYTKASTKQLVPRQYHNKEYIDTEQENKDGWYQRCENNGWRLVSDRILRKIDEDAVTYDSAQKKMEFKHCKLLRREDVEKKRKKVKIEWMKKMYKEGMLLTRHGMETPVVRDIEESLKGMVEVTEKKGYEGVDESMLRVLHLVKLLVNAPFITEKQMFFRDDRIPPSYTR
ncbi:Hypothetical predicted protein [Paramuricea clavata]|uniref:Uncharacterized protein n=1 Tax=Paramuricea clavata TaxID=317549 RepID=A0A7D9IBL5_PARCT|nr:Hypothetical predicted protein [Paramuricea clavata]